MPINFDALLEGGNDNNPVQGEALAAMDDAHGINPDQYAKTLALSKETDLPIDTVERNLPDVEKDATALSLTDKLAILNQAPGTEAWVAKNAKLVADDFSVMGRWKKELTDLRESSLDSADQQRIIELNQKMMGNQITPAEEIELQVLDESLSNVRRGTGGFVSSGLQGAAANSVQMGRTIGAGGIGTVVGGTGGAIVGGGVSLLAGPEAVPFGAAQGARIGGRFGGGIAAARENYNQQSALVFNDLRKMKDENGEVLDRDIARGAAIAVGVVNAGLDTVGLGKLLETVPGFDKLQGVLTRDGIKKAMKVPGMKEAFMQIGKKYATGVSVEATTEAAQQVTQIIGTEIAKKTDGGEFKDKSIGDMVDEVAAAFEGGASMATVIGGVGSSMKAAGVVRRGNVPLDPSQVQAHVEAINNAVRGEKLYQRSPEAFHDLVSTLGGDERFYISAEAVTQAVSQLSEDQQGALFNAIPSLKGELDIARHTGADVSIRKADYAGFIAPFEQADLLKEHIKLDPADMSVAERKAQAEFLANNPEVAKQISEQIGQIPKGATTQEMIPAIEKIVRKSMREAGLSADEAGSAAALYARTQARMAAAFGESGIEAINQGLLEFQTVDETGTPVKTGSNFSVLLNDLQRITESGKLPGADEQTTAAVKAFGERIKAAGLTPEGAAKLSSRELLDKIYADKPQQQVINFGDQQVTLPNVDVSANPDGSLNVGITPAEAVDDSENVLRQKYDVPPKEQAQGKDMPPETPYNGTDSEEFKAWFGDSAVVNEDGHPLVVYHGTLGDINAFKVGSEYGSELNAGDGIYFSADPDYASAYAGDRTAKDIMSNDAEGASVYPVYLSLQNPKVIEAPSFWERFRNKAAVKNKRVESSWMTPEKVAALQAEGYDGIINKAANEIIVFKPTQIKSIFNSGKFSSVDPNILNQTERGSITFNRSQDYAARLKSVVVAFTKNRNFSTGAHEFSHWAVAQHRMFVELARARIAAGTANAEIQRINDDWEKLKEKVGATSDRFTVVQEEQIAKLFEAYMREGNAPSESLRRVFTRYRDWLMKIYKDVKAILGEDQLDDDVRGVFDRWLASEDEIEQVRSKNSSLADTAIALGLPENIVQKIADYMNSAVAHAEEILYRKLAHEQKRRETAAYQNELKAMKAVVAEEVKQQREYKVVNYLKDTGLKLYVGPGTGAELGAPPVYEQYDAGESITLEDMERMERENDGGLKESLAYAMLAPKPKQPRTLIEFLKSKGGLKDDGGDLKSMDAGKLIRKKGLNLDAARELAVEAGYLKDAAAGQDRPSESTINDLLEAIDRELSGDPVYREADAGMVEEMHNYDQMVEYADRAGVTEKDIEQARADRKKWGNYSIHFTTQTETEGAVDPGEVSDLFGYDNVSDMLQALKALPQFSGVVEREAKQRLMGKYPDMISQGRIKNNAVEAIMNDRVLLALDLMIKELGRTKNKSQVGMKQFAEAIAQAQVEKMKLSDSGYGFRYDVARDREMRNALEKSRAGKPDEAMIHLQKAMVNQIMFRKLGEFTELRAKAEKLFAKVDSKDADLAPTKDIDFVGAARFILHKFGLGGENFDVNSWIKDIQERDPDTMNDLIGLSQMVDAPAVAAKDLTIADYRDIYNSIRNIYATARNMKEFEINGKKARAEAVTAELIAQVGDITQPLNDTTQITGMNKFRNVLSSTKAALRRVEAWTKAMDGGDGGPWNKYIWRVASDAEDTYKAERHKWLAGYHAILKKHSKTLKTKGRIDTNLVRTDNLGRSSRLGFKDKMELIGFLLHTGNESNLDKLLGGYGIKDKSQFYAEMERMGKAGLITEADWDLVQELWDYVEAIKPLTQQAHKKLYGYRFEEIENKPLDVIYQVETTGGGVTTVSKRIRGGYWPAIADPEQASNNKTVQQMLEQTRQYMLATTGRGFTKARIEQYRQPLKTDLRLGSNHIDKVLRFVYIEPATRDISRIINRQDLREVMKAKDFDAVDGMLIPWLQRFSQQSTEPNHNVGDRSATIYNRLTSFLRASAMSQLIRYNVVVAVQNIANMPVALQLVGSKNMAKSFAAVTTSPFEMIRDMRSASKMMEERMNSDAWKISQEINQIANRSGKAVKTRDFMLRHGFIFMRAVDSYLSAVTWHAAYNEQLEAGASDVDAVAHADSVIRQVMGAQGAKDVSKVEASSPLVKAIIPFYSYFNTQANLIATEFGNIMRKHGWAGSPKMFMAYISLIAAPALVGELIAGSLRDKLPEDDDDDGMIDDWLAWMFSTQLRYVGAMIPIAGQGVNAIVNRSNHNPMDDRLSISPVVSGIDTALRTGGNLVRELDEEDDVKDSRMIKDLMTTFGFLTNTPLGQISKPIGFAVDVKQEEVVPENNYQYIKGIVAGSPPKK